MRLEILFLKSPYLLKNVRLVVFEKCPLGKTIFVIFEFKFDDVKELKHSILQIEEMADRMMANDIEISEDHKNVDFGRSRKLISKAIKIVKMIEKD